MHAWNMEWNMERHGGAMDGGVPALAYLVSQLNGIPYTPVHAVLCTHARHHQLPHAARLQRLMQPRAVEPARPAAHVRQ